MRARSGDLDVEHHLAVRPVRAAAGRVLAMIHRDGHHLRSRRHTDRLEVRLQVGRLEASAQLDEPDALPLAGDRRKAVELRHLGRRERSARRMGRCHTVWSRGDPEMRAGLGAVVEAEHALHDVAQVRGHADRPGAAPVRAPGMLVARQPHPERGAKGAHRARQHHAPPRRAGLDHDEPVLLGELGDLLEIRGGGAVRLLELLPGHRPALAVRAGEQAGQGRLRPGSHPHRHLEALIRIDRSHRAGARHGSPLAAGERALATGHDSLLPVLHGR